MDRRLEDLAACPFVGTYVRNLDESGGMVKIQFPHELRRTLEFCNFSPHRILMRPRTTGKGIAENRPAWLERILEPTSEKLTLELTSKATQDFDCYRMIDVCWSKSSAEITFPKDLKEKCGIGNTFDYVIKDGKVTIETTIENMEQVPIQCEGRIQTQNTALAKLKPGSVFYYRPIIAKWKPRTPREKRVLQYCIEITTRPEFPTTAYRNTTVHKDGMIRIPPDMLSELEFPDVARITVVTHHTMRLYHGKEIDRYRRTSRNNNVALPKQVLDVFKTRPALLYLHIAGPQLPKTPSGKYWELRPATTHPSREDTIVPISEKYRMIFPPEILRFAKAGKEAVFVSRGNYIEMSIF